MPTPSATRCNAPGTLFRPYTFPRRYDLKKTSNLPPRRSSKTSRPKQDQISNSHPTTFSPTILALLQPRASSALRGCPSRFFRRRRRVQREAEQPAAYAPTRFPSQTHTRSARSSLACPTMRPAPPAAATPWSNSRGVRNAPARSSFPCQRL